MSALNVVVPNDPLQAVTTTFGLINMGYSFSATKVIQTSHAESIQAIVRRLLMPMVILHFIFSFDLSQFSWSLVGGILLAKAILFVAVAVCTAVLTLCASGKVHYGKCGMFASAAIFSNDLVVGISTIKVILDGSLTAPSKGFDLVAHIIFLEPFTIVIFVSVGVFLMSLWKESSKPVSFPEKFCKSYFQALKHALVNRNVFLPLVMVVGNIVLSKIFNHGQPIEKFPIYMASFIEILYIAYFGMALINLGVFMTGRIQRLSGRIVFISIALFLAKSVVLPVLSDRLVFHFSPTINASLPAINMSGFAVLYGMLPSSPMLFVFATEYGIAVDEIAVTVVMGTVFSVLAYLGGGMAVTARYFDPANLASIVTLVEGVRMDMIGMTAIAFLSIFILFAIARRYKSTLHVIILHSLLANLLACIGAELMVVLQTNLYWQYVMFFIFFWGNIAARVWIAWLPVALYFSVSRGQRTVNKLWMPMFLSGWGVPAALAVIVLAFSNVEEFEVDRTFIFGKAQLVCTFLALAVCIVVNIVFLALLILFTLKKNPLSIVAEEDDRQSTAPLTVNTDNLLDSNDEEDADASEKKTGDNSSTKEGEGEGDGEGQREQPVARSCTSVWEYKFVGNSFSVFFILSLVQVVSLFVALVHVAMKFSTSPFVITSSMTVITVVDIVFNLGQSFTLLLLFGMEVPDCDCCTPCITSIMMWLGRKYPNLALRTAKLSQPQAVSKMN